MVAISPSPTQLPDGLRRTQMQVPPDQLVLYPFNARKVIDDADPEQIELVASVRQLGVLTDLWVWENNGKLEVLAGQRRLRAAKTVGLRVVPVLVFELTEQQAYAISMVENLLRKDLTWWEQAAALETMKDREWDVATMANCMGKSVAWVYMRARLTHLSPKFRKLAETAGHPFRNWTPSMAEQVARLPGETQEAMLAGNAIHQVERCRTAKDVKELIETEYLHLLSSAPWELDDAKLVPKAGACSACPHRSSCQQDLFAAEKGGDRCLNGPCWEKKAEVHRNQKLKQLQADNPKAPVVMTSEARRSQIPDPKGAVSEWDVQKVKASAPGAKAAIFMEPTGPRVGFISTQKAGMSGRPPATVGPKPAKVRIEEVLKRRRRKAIGLVIEALGGDPEASPSRTDYATPKKAGPEVKRPALLSVVAMAIAAGIREGGGEHDGEGWGKRLVAIAPMKGEELHDQLFAAVRQRLVGKLAAARDYDPQVRTEGAQAVTGMCGMHWDLIEAKAQDACPLPKSLAEEYREDGKPHRAAGAAGKKAKKGKG